MKEFLGRTINEVGHKFKVAVRNEVNKRGIPSSYFKILMFIAQHEGACNQSDIIDFANFKPSTISITLSNMENEGYIKREKDKEDKRKTIVSSTTKGKEASEVIKGVFDNIENDLSNSITADQKEKLLEILKNLYDCLGKWVNDKC